MVLAKSSAGIEIAGPDLRLAVLRSSLGKIRLLATHRIAGFLDLDEEAKKKAFRALVRSRRIPTARVYLALPREQGIVRQVDLPGEMSQKLAGVVRLQVETLSPWPLEEIYWDFGRGPQKKNGKLITITIAIIPRTILDPWIAFFKSVGVPLSGATLSSLAFANGTNALWKDAIPTIVLRQEHSYTEAVAVNGSRIAALTVPATEDTLSQPVIERLLPVAKLASAEGARLFVCGEKLDTTILEDNPALPIEGAKREFTRDFGAIATALVLLKESTFKSNLVPPALRYRESLLRLIPAYVLGILAACVGLALLVRGPYQNTVYASRLDAEIRKVAPQVREVAGQEAELNQLSGKSRALVAQLANHDYNLEALRELSRVLPASAFLVSYGYQDGNVTISGFAESASEIQNLLETSSMFKGAEFTNSVTRDATGKDRFTMKMTAGIGQ